MAEIDRVQPVVSAYPAVQATNFRARREGQSQQSPHREDQLELHSETEEPTGEPDPENVENPAESPNRLDIEA